MIDDAVDRAGRPRRPGPVRAGVLAAALTAGALLVAACGSSGSPSGAGLTAYQKALAFAQCMRAHGEPGFPDPNSHGNFLIQGPADHLNGRLMARANKTCRHLLPHNGVPTAAQLKKATAESLKFVACMRAHGVPGMPDPVVQNGGIGIQLGHGVDPNSPVFKSAQHACQHLSPFNGGGP